MLACSLVTRTCLKTTRGLISGTFRRLTLADLSHERNNCSVILKLFKFLITLLAGLFEMRGCWHIGLRWAIVALWATCFFFTCYTTFNYHIVFWLVNYSVILCLCTIFLLLFFSNVNFLTSLWKRLRIHSVISVNCHYVTVLCPINLSIHFKCYNTLYTNLNKYK